MTATPASAAVSASRATRRGQQTPPRSTATTPSRGRHRRRDIQGLRAIAVIAVVAYHAGLPLPGGFAGVDMFFVISGFVIAGVLHRELLAHGRISFADFYGRRIRRILPAAALLLVVATAASALLLSPVGMAQKAAGEAASASSVFLANAYFYLFAGGYFEPTAESNPFLHMWSLSVEEQFYLVFPVFLVGLWWVTRRWGVRALLAGLIAVGLASFALCVAYSLGAFVSAGKPLATIAPTDAMSAAFAFYSPLTRAWEFLAGAALAIALARFRPRRRIAQAAAWIGVALIAATMVLLNSEQAFPGYLALLPVLGTVALLLAGSGATTPAPTRALSVPQLTYVGDRSYSWYLWHWPLIVFALLWFPTSPAVLVGTAAGLLSLLPALAAYRWVENPIHEGRALPSSRATVVILVIAVAVPFLAGRALIAAWQAHWGRDDIRTIQQTVVPTHLDQANGCAATTVTLATQPEACTFATPGARGTVLLVGDSNGGHFTEGVVAAAHRLKLDVEVLTGASCPLVRLPTPVDPACGQWTETNLALIGERPQPYAAVILGTSPSYASSLPAVLAGPGQALPADYDEALTRWGQAVAATAADLGQSAPVVLVDQAPQIEARQGVLPECLLPSILSAGPQPGCGEASPQSVDAGRDRVVAAVRKVTGGRHTHFDASALQCDETRTCRAVRDGIPLYRDNSHLSVAGALAYTDEWEKTLRDVAVRR